MGIAGTFGGAAYASSKARDVQLTDRRRQVFVQYVADTEHAAGLPDGSKYEPTLHTAEAQVLLLTSGNTKLRTLTHQVTDAALNGKDSYPKLRDEFVQVASDYLK